MWAESRFLAGQRVEIHCPSLDVLGTCSVIDVDEEAQTVSVVTKYDTPRRFVKGLPWGSVTAEASKTPYGGDGTDQRAHGAMERMVGRFVEHSKVVGQPMGRPEALNRARTIAARNHGHGPPKTAVRRKERDNG